VKRGRSGKRDERPLAVGENVPALVGPELREYLGVGVVVGQVAASGCAVSEEEPWIVRVVGVKRHPEQAPLLADDHVLGQVEERLRFEPVGADRPDLTGLIEDVPPSRVRIGRELRRQRQPGGDRFQRDRRPLRGWIVPTQHRDRTPRSRDCRARADSAQELAAGRFHLSSLSAAGWG